MMFFREKEMERHYFQFVREMKEQSGSINELDISIITDRLVIFDEYEQMKEKLYV